MSIFYCLMVLGAFRPHVTLYIQDVPGAKVNILGVILSASLSKNVYVYMCPIPNGFRDRAISLYSSKIVDKKEILQSWYSLPSIIYFRKFHRQHQCTWCTCTYIIFCLEWPILWPPRKLTFPPGTHCIPLRKILSVSYHATYREQQLILWNLLRTLTNMYGSHGPESDIQVL
jgi:hypothetical protein